MSLRNKIVILNLILLFVLIGFTSCKSSDIKLEENEKIIIKANDNEIGEITLDEIKNLESYKRRVVINSSNGTETSDFRGVLLSDILNLIDSSLISTYDEAQIVGADGYYSNVTMEEIKKENKVFIMYADNEEPLKSLNGKVDSLRLIVLGDDFGQRYTNYVVEVRLQ